MPKLQVEPWVSSQALAHRICSGRAARQHYAVGGFEIPSLPALSAESPAHPELVKEILHRFQMYVLDLHDSSARRTVALQIMAHPEQSMLGSLVRVYVLCRSARDSAAEASKDAKLFTRLAADCFPAGGVFSYGKPTALSATDLAHALFQCRPKCRSRRRASRKPTCWSFANTRIGRAGRRSAHSATCHIGYGQIGRWMHGWTSSASWVKFRSRRRCA